MESKMLSFNEILKVFYSYRNKKKICLSDDVNNFLEEGNSSYKIYIFLPNVYKIITNLQTSYTSRVEMNTEV